MPPVGTTRVWGGACSRSRSTSGVNARAGNRFTAAAPASSAATISVALPAPGSTTSPYRWPQAGTAGCRDGHTRKRSDERGQPGACGGVADCPLRACRDSRTDPCRGRPGRCRRRPSRSGSSAAAVYSCRTKTSAGPSWTRSSGEAADCFTTGPPGARGPRSTAMPLPAAWTGSARGLIASLAVHFGVGALLDERAERALRARRPGTPAVLHPPAERLARPPRPGRSDAGCRESDRRRTGRSRRRGVRRRPRIPVRLPADGARL